jgi:cytochrome c55X
MTPTGGLEMSTTPCSAAATCHGRPRRASACAGWSLLGLLITATAVVAAPTPERQIELRRLLIQDCGSCHGLTLKGGLGPALLPADLAAKPADFLAAVILYGRPGTPMPPWRPFLSDADAAWLAQQLREGVQ